MEMGLHVQPWTYQARALGDEDVEIQISHCGICGSDLHTMGGGWGDASYPVVAGHEIIGVVTAAGEGVKHLAVGDRVGVGAQVFACLQDTCEECSAGQDSYCQKIVYTYDSQYADGSEAYGGYADYVRVSSHYAFKIPESIPSELAAPLLCAGTTVFTPLKYNIKAGDRVGVVGIGGLGHLALQFVKALGATAVAFSHSPSKEEEAKRLGASEFVNVSDPAAATRAEKSVAVLLVTANADNLPYDTYLSFVRPRGTFIMVGLPNDKIAFSPSKLIGPGISFVGSKIGSIKDIKEMLELAAEKNVHPIIQRLPMSQVNEGIQMVHSGKARYRVVLENTASMP